MQNTKLWLKTLCVVFAVYMLFQLQYGDLGPGFYEGRRSSSCNVLQREYLMPDVKERFRRRRERMLKVCQEVENKEDIDRSIKTRIIYFWKYNVSVCTMTKVGSTNWRTHAQKINEVKGQPMTEGRRTHLINRALDKAVSYTKSTSRWISVRHPLTRLVSCYQDKYRNGSSSSEWKKNNLEEFLFPALLSNGLVYKSQESSRWRKYLAKTGTSVKNLDPKDERLRSSVTFTEFLRHVVHTFEAEEIDKHWKTYGLLCSPCFFEYDYIAKIETHSQDLKYMFEKFRIPSNPQQTVKTRENVLVKVRKDSRYYNTVPLELKEKIYNIYQTDMEMFDYNLPEDYWNTP
ncbi:carbohydrate sulfotransferase 8-like [Penaeus monodon]|uniref:carbohydrate sulfotransferase 8-like n=1 Tax=Penaeus monodon TaxID=6687 RepID=UPI0018A7A89F|nr:carbohydrate sulfotransferase 8-like [Penaeus monodon]